MCQFAYDFSIGMPLNLLIIYGKDPNFKNGACSVIGLLKCLKFAPKYMNFSDGNVKYVLSFNKV